MNEYNIEEPNMKIQKIVRKAIIAAVVIVLVGVGVYEYQIHHASGQDHAVNFQIAKGASTRQIANSLFADKLISSPRFFLIYVYLHNTQSKIQAGTYSLNTDMSISKTADALAEGDIIHSEKNLTIIEGWNNQQIANYLVDEKVISGADDFTSVLKNTNFNFGSKDLAKQFSYQGFLFPDTYKLAADQTAGDLVSKMLNNFSAKLTDKMTADIQSKNRNLGDVLILASIVEKEVGRNQNKVSDADLAALQDERALVASVFYNRLAIGMPLESDATVNYVTGKFDRSATLEDTKIKSPYNTYQVKGLPPTPISNPGIGSIEAAINPAESDYLYFLNAPNGKAYFAKTLAEHNANRAKYLK